MFMTVFFYWKREINFFFSNGNFLKPGPTFSSVANVQEATKRREREGRRAHTA
ncbi:hypothetical protein Hanom_Chr06g00496651 [Helianthus anomalus]